MLIVLCHIVLIEVVIGTIELLLAVEAFCTLMTCTTHAQAQAFVVPELNNRPGGLMRTGNGSNDSAVSKRLVFGGYACQQFTARADLRGNNRNACTVAL